MNTKNNNNDEKLEKVGVKDHSPSKIDNCTRCLQYTY